MSEALGELLSLLSGDEQDNYKEGVFNPPSEKQPNSRDRLVKASRKLVAINIASATENYLKIRPAENKENFLHRDGSLSSSEDEFERHHDERPHLSEYGRSIKRQLKASSVPVKTSPPKSSGNSIRSLKRTVNEARQALQEKAHKTVEAVNFSIKDSVTFFDPFFKIRVRNPLLSSETFKAYCEGLDRVRISQLKPRTDNNWISVAVIVDKSACRRSANNNEYMIWKISDLLDCQEKPVKVLLFGDCVKNFWKLQFGYVIAIIGAPFAENDGKEVTLKLTKCAQLVELGFAPDFGHCKALKKDGTKCSNFVNISQCDRCVYHAQVVARRSFGQRGIYGTITAGAVCKNEPSKSQQPASLSNVVTNNRRVDKKETSRLTIDSIRFKQRAVKTAQERSQVGTMIKNEEDRSARAVSNISQAKDLRQDNGRTAKPNSDADAAKRKAIQLVLARGGIEKADPNSLRRKPRKRLSASCVQVVPEKNLRRSNAVDTSATQRNGKESFTDNEIKALLNAKSSHERELQQEDLRHEVTYFDTMQQKEKLENFLTTTREVKNCNVVTCAECKYTWHKQSELCAASGHRVKHHKANKRFFKCRTCQRRTICYELMPTKPCEGCGESAFDRVAMRDERKVKLPTEDLKLRGEERKYVNS